MKALGFLLNEAITPLDYALRKLCREVIEDRNFQKSPGGISRHHAYRGGLLIHTAEVVWAASRLAESSIVDCQVLITAAVFHDRNKIFEYELTEDNKIQGREYRQLIGHVAGSRAVLHRTRIKTDRDQPIDSR